MRMARPAAVRPGVAALLALSCVLPATGQARAPDTGEDAATCTANAITTPETNACAQAGLDRAEADLNATYQRIRAQLADPACGAHCARTRELLTEAQRSWVAFRRGDCDAAWQYYADGTIRTVTFLSCMARHAETRTRELEAFYEDER